MPSNDTESPRRSSEIAAVPDVDDAIELFRSETAPDGEAREWTAPPTGYRPVVPEEIHPTAQRSTGILIGAAVALLATLLGVALIINRQHPAPRLPLELTPQSDQSAEQRVNESAPASVAPAIPAAPPAGPPATARATPSRPETPARTTVAPNATVERSAALNPPAAAAVNEPATPREVTSEARPPDTATAAAVPVPAVPSITGTVTLDHVAAAAVVPAPPPVPAMVDPLTRDRAAIRRTLDVYRESYSALDASAVSMIWVGLDTKALQRAFSTLSSQDLAFDHCELDIAAARNRARASCTGVLNYVRRIGSADEHQRQMTWAIDLVRSSDRWMIENVTAR